MTIALSWCELFVSGWLVDCECLSGVEQEWEGQEQREIPSGQEYRIWKIKGRKCKTIKKLAKKAKRFNVHTAEASQRIGSGFDAIEI